MNSKLHIAIIPDGNRRWAKAQGQPAFFGHQHGAQNFMKILEAAAAPERGIYAVTIWALSTENVRKRSETELAGIWKLLTQIEKHLPDFHKHGVRFRTIRTGEQSRLSGFLPLHMAYSELYFSDKMWPAFTESDLDEALAWFRSQKRNFGK